MDFRVPLAVAASLLIACRPGPAQQLDAGQLEAVLRGAAAAAIPPMGTSAQLLGPPDLPLVEVRLNGKGPYRLLVDLGSNVMILRRDVADDAGLEVVLDRETSDIVRARTLQIADARFDDVWFGAYDELDVDGVVGYNLLMGTGIVLDYPGRMLRLGPLELGEPDGDRTLAYEVASRLPYVHARVGDRDLLMNLDTGAFNWVVFPMAMADSLPLESSPQPGPALTNNQTGTTRNFVARLAVDLRIGGHVIERPVVMFDPAVEDAWLGSGILTRSRLELDTRRRVFRLTPKTPLVAPPYRTLGVGLGPFDPSSGTRPVTDLIPGTAAAGELQPGDAVVSIGGISATGLDARTLRRLCADGAKTVEIEVRRDGVSRTLSLEVAALPR
jgi:hypothetical protein